MIPAEFRRFPKKWQVLPFLQVFKDATSGKTKIKKEDFLAEGKLPIVDQGQSHFGGYTNDKGCAVDSELPSIVFGDHTRAFKFIEEPFALGADGAKLLEPIVEADKKFLFFYLKQLKLESAGYSRHFKFLKKTYIPLPPLPVQKQIAAVLEKADTLRSQCQQMEQEFNSLAQSVFLDMFGDPATNPKSWPIAPVKEFLKVTTGNTPPKAVNEYYSDNHIEWAKSDNINTPSDYLTQASTYLSEKGKAVGRTVPTGSILVTCIAGSPSCIGNAAITDREVAFNQQINAVTPIETKCISEFVYMSFIVGKSLIQRASTNSMKGMVSKGNFEKIEFPLPPIELQKQYCDIFQTILRSRQDASMNYRSNVDLFNSLMQRAFKGELDLKDVA